MNFVIFTHAWHQQWNCPLVIMPTLTFTPTQPFLSLALNWYRQEVPHYLESYFPCINILEYDLHQTHSDWVTWVDTPSVGQPMAGHLHHNFDEVLSRSPGPQRLTGSLQLHCAVVWKWGYVYSKIYTCLHCIHMYVSTHVSHSLFIVLKKRGKFHFIHISTHACTGRLKKLTQHFSIFSACYIFSMHSFMKDMCMYKKQDLFLLQSIFTRNTFHTCTYQHIHVWSSISCFILFIQEYVCTKELIISLNIYESLLLCYMYTINN